MQGLSGIRISQCFFPSSGRSPAANKQYLVLLGFQQTSSSLKCCRKTLAPRIPKLRTSLQDGAATENAPRPLGEEVSRNLVEEEATHDDVSLEEGPKVKVKFVLEKKCHFGQKFNVVGNDPLFGNWEVKAAIPMQWAEGDIWTVEVDVPAEEQFEFKFVMTGKKGEAVWQPGSNRILNAVGGISPLVVNEAWEVGDLVKDTITTSESDGTLVPKSGTEDAAKDEVLKALESKVDDVHSTPESDFEEPEVPMAELDIAAPPEPDFKEPEFPVAELATAVKAVAGVDDTA